MVLPAFVGTVCGACCSASWSDLKWPTYLHTPPIILGRSSVCVGDAVFVNVCHFLFHVTHTPVILLCTARVAQRLAAFYQFYFNHISDFDEGNVIIIINHYFYHFLTQP